MGKDVKTIETNRSVYSKRAKRYLQEGPDLMGVIGYRPPIAIDQSSNCIFIGLESSDILVWHVQPIVGAVGELKEVLSQHKRAVTCLEFD